MPNAILFIRKSVLGMTQKQLADVAGVRQATVSRWESGELCPSVEEMRLIRDHVIKSEKDWDDSWVWEGPKGNEQQAGEAA